MTNEKDKTPKRKTIGEIDIEARKTDVSHLTAREVIDHFAPLYVEEMQYHVDKGIKRFNGNPFFLEGLPKNIPLYKKVLPIIVWEDRESCPNPTLDQFAYRISDGGKKWEELWILPKGEVYNTLITKKYDLDLLPDERILVEYCCAYKEGKLQRLSDSYLIYRD